MKKLLLFAAIMSATIGVAAQSPADSIRIALARTNTELSRFENAMSTHAAFVGLGSAVEAVGAFFLYRSATTELPNEASKAAKVGVASMGLGAAIVALSFIPLPKGIRLDERGMVIDLPSKSKKRK